MAKYTKGVDHKYSGSMSVKQLRRLSIQVDAAIIDIEKSIAKATKGIDPTRKEDIRFAVNNLVSKWSTGEIKPPPSVFKLNMLLRAAPDKESRGLQIISRISLPTIIPGGGHKLSISGKRDFTRTLLVNRNLVGDPQGIYETLNRLNKLNRTLNDVQGTKYSENLDQNILKEYGIILDINKGSRTPVNAYYNSANDLSLKGAHMNDYESAREDFMTNFPDEYLANPGKFRTNLNPQNRYYRKGTNNNTEGDNYGPLNTANGIYKKGDFKGIAKRGETPWTKRSERGPGQANADTRALLIQKGANPSQVNRLSNDVLSRFRISGGFETKGNYQLLVDGGPSINLKLNKDRQFNSGGYGVTNDSEGIKSTVLPKKDKKTLTIGERISNFETKLANSFDEPLE